MSQQSDEINKVVHEFFKNKSSIIGKHERP